MDIIGSGGVTLVDEKGNELVFSYFQRKAYFVTDEKTKVPSQPGSPQEQCLLKVLKELFASIHDPAFDKDPGGTGTEKFRRQRAVKHFIRLLEGRCATKSEDK